MPSRRSKPNPKSDAIFQQLSQNNNEIISNSSQQQQINILNNKSSNKKNHQQYDDEQQGEIISQSSINQSENKIQGQKYQSNINVSGNRNSNNDHENENQGMFNDSSSGEDNDRLEMEKKKRQQFWKHKKLKNQQIQSQKPLTQQQIREIALAAVQKTNKKVILLRKKNQKRMQDLEKIRMAQQPYLTTTNTHFRGSSSEYSIITFENTGRAYLHHNHSFRVGEMRLENFILKNIKQESTANYLNEVVKFENYAYQQRKKRRHNIQ